MAGIISRRKFRHTNSRVKDQGTKRTAVVCRQGFATYRRLIINETSGIDGLCVAEAVLRFSIYRMPWMIMVTAGNLSTKTAQVCDRQDAC
jgi:hypothetical protein